MIPHCCVITNCSLTAGLMDCSCFLVGADPVRYLVANIDTSHSNGEMREILYFGRVTGDLGSVLQCICCYAIFSPL